MGYVFDQKDAEAYLRWLQKPRNRRRVDLENRLMAQMLDPMRGESLLDIGCGTGESLRSLLQIHLMITGLDPSDQMLNLARENVGRRADFHSGVAEDLPFDDNDFNCAVLINTLEFVDDPRKSLEETFRVAKDRVFIGILNRYSGRNLLLRKLGKWTQGKWPRICPRSYYGHARFFSVWEIKRMIRSLAGDVPVTWRTIHQVPMPGVNRFVLDFPERLNLVLKSPLASFTGISVILTPRYRTRVMRLECTPRRNHGAITGLARAKWQQLYGRGATAAADRVKAERRRTWNPEIHGSRL
jgi:SAM-dependent methyltransferase